MYQLKFNVIVLLLISLLCSTGSALAAPKLSVQTAEGELIFRVSNTTQSGCDYDLYLSKNRKRLRRPKAKDLVLTTSETSFESSGLPVLRSKRKRTKYFFRVKESCGDDQSLSNVRRFRVTTSSKKSGLKKRIWRDAFAESLVPSGLTLKRMFSSLTLSSLVDLQFFSSTLAFVSEQSGILSSFDPSQETPSKSTVLDLTGLVADGIEQGLLSSALHPNYESNGYIFVHYSAKGADESSEDNGATRISRFTVSDPSAPVADLSSELVLLTLNQPYFNHNGGSILFGPDGYLYISLGDGGNASDPLENGQDTTNLWGTILRIDVDRTGDSTPYAIPDTNPFASSADGSRPEIFAYGVRNIWKMSFDPLTGALIAGDVGQNTKEEINLIENGKNYGWDEREGFICHEPATDCSNEGFTDPLIDYPRTEGVSVTGGVVYRGSEIPFLEGKYLFGDFLGPDAKGGKIWIMDPYNGKPYKAEIFDTDLFVAGFANDKNGEVYVLSYLDGAIFKVTQEDQSL